MKACPYCKEKIQDDAIKCRYCAEFLETPGGEVAPATTGKLDPALEEAQESVEKATLELVQNWKFARWFP